MRELERCDGCGNVISDSVTPWTFQSNTNSAVVYVTHPNDRCADGRFDRKGGEPYPRAKA